MDSNEFRIGERLVGNRHPTYFIADISANHDGDLGRAKALIRLAAESGADAAKFQNFRAEQIVSARGFNSLGGKFSHQSRWKKSVTEVYREASVPWEWTQELKKECDRTGIHYFSTPYDLEAVDMLAPYVPVFKIGSGDITWPEIIAKISSMGKPVIIATGASSVGEVQAAVDLIRSFQTNLVLMQCNTNYTGSLENFKHIHLNVLQTYRVLFPHVSLGLSDHTPGHTTVLGAVTLGARFVEKHFTDDTRREGPDHSFSMTPQTWREMVDRTRELEYALGDTKKRIGENEKETVIVQRRCLRASKNLKAGAILRREDVDVLRPAPSDGIFPDELGRVIGSRLRRDVQLGDHFRWVGLE